MAPPPPDLVASLLGDPGNSELAYRVHRKKGRVFALMPSNPRLQARLAPLLPAQSPLARLYRALVRLTGMAGVSFPRETRLVRRLAESPLASLCQEITTSASAPLLLPGNPHGAAPRLVVIVPDSAARPAGVIKTGNTTDARNLVRREAEVLARTAQLPKARIAPRVIASIDTAEVTAFAMTFAAGRSPRWPSPASRLEEFLCACVDRSRTMSLAETALWKSLGEATAGQGEFRQIREALGIQMIHPCLFHGDLAPWNVRESPGGRWTAIDWERGERRGVPGWDWLHFVIQPAILVKKWPVSLVLELARGTITSPEFARYLAKSFPNGMPSDAPEAILRSYLLYNWHVLQPSERRFAHEQLAKWAA